MKILHVINSLNTGGAEKLLLETIPLYAKRKINVDLLIIDGTKYPYLAELKKTNSCKIISLGRGNLYNPINVLKIIPYLYKYDIIHAHLFPVQYWVVIAKFLCFSKTKFVFTEHSTSNRRIQNNKLKHIERFIYSLYDKIICISYDVKNIFINYTKLNEKRFQVIENGINLLKIRETQPVDKILIHPSISTSDKLLIQIAGFRIEKDQKTVIKSLVHLPVNVKLLLVGDGSLIEECEKLTLDLDLTERVVFLGVRTDAATLLKTSDISIVSSHWEGFGLVAIESMAAGKPLLASNIDGLASVVDGAAILFEKNNEIDLALKIEEILNNRLLYENLVLSGINRAQKYDINKMVDTHIDMYEDLLKTKFALKSER